MEYEPCKHSGCLNGPTRHKFWLDDDTLGIIPISDDDYHFKLDKLVVAVADKLKQAKALKERQLRLEEHIALQKQNMMNNQDFDCFVVLHGDEQDLSLAEEIGPLLAENGISYALPLVKTIETLSSDIRNDFESNVIRCDAILIFYDKTTQSWIREQLRICQDIERQRGRRLTMIGVHRSKNNPDFGMWLKNQRNYECPPEDIQTYLPKFIAELKQAASLGAL